MYSTQCRREKLTTAGLFALIVIAIPLLYYTDLVESLKSIPLQIYVQSADSRAESVIESTSTGTTEEATTTKPTTTTTTTSTTTPFEVIVDMNEQTPAYKLATRNGTKPFIDDARVTIFEVLNLYDKCRQDSSIIVVDVGANSGDFGLYTAACGCTVYMFEVEPILVALIRISVQINAFSPKLIHLYHNIVSDEPSSSTVELKSAVDVTANTEIPIAVTSIQLDDISWPSSIFLLKIDFDDGEIEVLRSAQHLFYDKRVQNLILYYNSVINDQTTKQNIINHIKIDLKPKLVYIFHSNGKQLYGPLSQIHLKELPALEDKGQPVIGLFAVFDRQIRRNSIKAERYDSKVFFT